jgi:hypothetical protein
MKMKKFFVFLMMLFVTAIAVMAQEQPDSTNVVIVSGFDTIVEFLKANMWSLIFIVYAFLETLFGQTNLIKQGSVLGLIWSWIGKLIKKQVPSIKGKYMTDKEIKAVRGGK